MKKKSRNNTPASSPPSNQKSIGFSFQEDLWFGDFDDDSARAAAASSMAAMAGRIMGARPFPAAAQRLVQLTRRDDTQIQKVVRVLESDPGLSQRVLRLVNSAGYGLRVRCTSLNHATALLGQQRLQQIATSAVLLDHFGKTGDVTRRKQEHGSLVASLCRYLAIHLGLPQEDLFTCGLLHDLGQLMMLDEGDTEYEQLVISHEGHWDTLHISEREILGFDHAVLAAHVLASWSIPAPVPEVIALHHQPALAHQRGAKISAMVQTVRFADHMSHLLENVGQEQGARELSESEAASYLSFSEMQIAAMWKDLQQLRDANRSRRMDIADIAPRSIEVPASLAPREFGISENPSNYSAAPPAAASLAPIEEPSSPETLCVSSPPYDNLDGPNLSYTEIDPTPSVANIMRLEQATPVALAAPMGHAPSNDQAMSPERANPVAEVRSGPEVFPCAICYGPTFGARCPVCSAHVCSTHQTSEREWCMACEDEYQAFSANDVVSPLTKIAIGSAFVVTVGSAFLFFGLDAGFGTLGMCLMGAIAAFAAYQVYLKVQFKQERRTNESEDQRPYEDQQGADFAGLPGANALTIALFNMEEPEETDNSSAQNAPPVQTPTQTPVQPQVHKVELRGDGYSSQGTQPSPLIVGEPSVNDQDVVMQRLNQETMPAPVENPGRSMSPFAPHPSQTPVAQASQAPLNRSIDLPAASEAASEPPPASAFSWPPSQETPTAHQRASLIAMDPVAPAPRIRFSEPPAPMHTPASTAPTYGAATSEQTAVAQEPARRTESDTQQSQSHDSQHNAIAPPPSLESMAATEAEKQLFEEQQNSFEAPEPPSNQVDDSIETGQPLDEAPLCAAGVLEAKIVPPIFKPQTEFCTQAPDAMARIIPLALHLPSDAPLPQNDTQSRQANGNL